jgi:plasmid stability protein
MGSMVIRNIPDDVLARLKENARIAGKSTEQLAREALAEKAKPSREEIIRRMDEIRAMSKPVSGQQIIDEIRWDRDHNLGKDISGLDGDDR